MVRPRRDKFSIMRVISSFRKRSMPTTATALMIVLLFAAAQDKTCLILGIIFMEKFGN